MLRTLRRGVVWCCLLALCALLAVAVVVPRLAGATPYTVLTGSMSPAYPPGSLVVVRPAPAEEIGIGTVLTYQRESGRPAVVTHRVVGLGFRDGETVFRTQGDANPVPDADWVLPVQLRGEVWYSIPYAGHLTGLLSLEQRSWGVRILAGGLLLYALVMIGSGILERRRRPGQEHQDDESGEPARAPVGAHRA